MDFVHRLGWTVWLIHKAIGQGRYPFRSRAAIRRDQSRRVRAIVAFAYRRVPYYRETMDRLGLTPADFRDVDDLAKLPLLEREPFQRDPEYFVSSALSRKHSLRLHTGGSAGKPITVFNDTASALALAAHYERLRAAFTPTLGRRSGYRETVIASPADTAVDLRQYREGHTFLSRALGLWRQRLSVHDPLEKNLALLDGFRPDLLATYGSYLDMLFRRLAETGQTFHAPKVVLYGADSLSPGTRNIMTERYGIQVFCAYGCTEAHATAFECEQHRGVHVNADVHPVRIVDEGGEPLPHGELGDVVVSNLICRGTVLLNYRLGDIAALQPDPCPCGRNLPLLSLVEGRSDDRLELPTGRTVQPFELWDVFRFEEDVWQYQVEQETPSHLRVSLVVGSGCDRAALRERVAARLARVCGDGITWDTVFVDSIERTATGKHRSVLSLARRKRLEGISPRRTDGAPSQEA